MSASANSEPARPRALMLSPETPYPVQGGGALRTASLLQYLARDYDVDLIVFRHHPEQDPAAALPRNLVHSVQVIDLPYNRKDLFSRITRNLGRLLRGVPPLLDRFQGFSGQFQLRGRYQLAVIEHFWCASYQQILAAVSDRVVLNLHNIESVLHHTCALADPPLEAFAHRHFANRALQLERTWLPKFHSILATSESDAIRLRQLHDLRNVVVYPNAIPFVPVPDRQEEDVIAFSGNLEYHPNRTAVQFFARHVWPTLSARNPQLKWRLIGMNPQAIQRDIQGLDRVEMTGPIADAIAELASAKVIVAPLRSGSGTRLKIIEAWASARPVVSTRIGAEGLPAVDGTNIYLADEPLDLVKSIERLLSSREQRRAVGNAGRYVFEQECSWEAAWRTLDCTNWGSSVDF